MAKTLMQSSLTSRILKSVAMLGSAQSVNILCSIVRTKFMAVWLGPAGVGFNSIMTNGSALMSNATLLSLRDSAVRDVAKLVNHERLAIKCKAIRRCALLFGTVGALMMILFSPLFSIFSFSGSADYSFYFAALAPFVFCTAYSAGEAAIQQGCNRLKTIAKINVYTGIVATVLSVPLLYVYRMSAIVVVIDLYALTMACFSCIFRVRTSAVELRHSWQELWIQSKSFLVLGLSMTLSVLFLSVAQYALASYINTVSGESALGIYQSGNALVNSYIGIVFTAIGLEYYPRISRFAGRPRMAQTIVNHEIGIVTALIAPLSVAFISMGGFVVRMLYSSSFEATMPFISLAMVGTVFRGVSFCFAYRILAAGDSKVYILVEFISTALGLTLNIAGYHYLSYAGLGLAYTLWYSMYTLMTAYVCRRRYKQRIPQAQLWLMALAVAVSLLSIYLRDIVGWWLPMIAILPGLLLLSYKILKRR